MAPSTAPVQADSSLRSFALFNASAVIALGLQGASPLGEGGGQFKEANVATDAIVMRDRMFIKHAGARVQKVQPGSLSADDGIGHGLTLVGDELTNAGSMGDPVRDGVARDALCWVFETPGGEIGSELRHEGDRIGRQS